MDLLDIMIRRHFEQMREDVAESTWINPLQWDDRTAARQPEPDSGT